MRKEVWIAPGIVYMCHPHKLITEHRTLNTEDSTLNTVMTIKPYTKQELASMYFPDADQATARIHLWRWITRCQPLNDALCATHLSKWTRTYTPQQVALIVRHLGEPESVY